MLFTRWFFSRYITSSSFRRRYFAADTFILLHAADVAIAAIFTLGYADTAFSHCYFFADIITPILAYAIIFYILRILFSPCYWYDYCYIAHYWLRFFMFRFDAMPIDIHIDAYCRKTMLRFAITKITMLIFADTMAMPRHYFSPLMLCHYYYDTLPYAEIRCHFHAATCYDITLPPMMKNTAAATVVSAAAAVIIAADDIAATPALDYIYDTSMAAAIVTLLAPHADITRYVISPCDAPYCWSAFDAACHDTLFAIAAIRHYDIIFTLRHITRWYAAVTLIVDTSLRHYDDIYVIDYYMPMLMLPPLLILHWYIAIIFAIAQPLLWYFVDYAARLPLPCHYWPLKMACRALLLSYSPLFTLPPLLSLITTTRHATLSFRCTEISHTEATTKYLLSHTLAIVIAISMPPRYATVITAFKDAADTISPYYYWCHFFHYAIWYWWYAIRYWWLMPLHYDFSYTLLFSALCYYFSCSRYFFSPDVMIFWCHRPSRCLPLIITLRRLLMLILSIIIAAVGDAAAIGAMPLRRWCCCVRWWCCCFQRHWYAVTLLLRHWYAMPLLFFFHYRCRHCCHAMPPRATRHVYRHRHHRRYKLRHDMLSYCRWYDIITPYCRRRYLLIFSASCRCCQRHYCWCWYAMLLHIIAIHATYFFITLERHWYAYYWYNIYDTLLRYAIIFAYAMLTLYIWYIYIYIESRHYYIYMPHRYYYAAYVITLRYYWYQLRWRAAAFFFRRCITLSYLHYAWYTLLPSLPYAIRSQSSRAVFAITILPPHTPRHTLLTLMPLHTYMIFRAMSAIDFRRRLSFYYADIILSFCFRHAITLISICWLRHYDTPFRLQSFTPIRRYAGYRCRHYAMPDTPFSYDMTLSPPHTDAAYDVTPYIITLPLPLIHYYDIRYAITWSLLILLAPYYAGYTPRRARRCCHYH